MPLVKGITGWMLSGTRDAAISDAGLAPYQQIRKKIVPDVKFDAEERRALSRFFHTPPVKITHIMEGRKRGVLESFAIGYRENDGHAVWAEHKESKSIHHFRDLIRRKGSQFVEEARSGREIL